MVRAIRLQPARGRKRRCFVLENMRVKDYATGNHRISHTSQKSNFSYDGNTVSMASSANYDHQQTSLGRLQNTPIAVGGYFPYNKKVEAIETGSWRELADFPLVEKSISQYSMVTFNDSLYLFGKFYFLSRTEFTIYLRGPLR